MQSWNLREIETDGTRDPIVLLSENGVARGVLIELTAGQELGDHQVKEHAWIVVVDGVARISSGATQVEAPAGVLAHFEPDERHAVRSEHGAKILLLLAPWPGKGHYRGDSAAAAKQA